MGELLSTEELEFAFGSANVGAIRDYIASLEARLRAADKFREDVQGNLYLWGIGDLEAHDALNAGLYTSRKVRGTLSEWVDSGQRP